MNAQVADDLTAWDAAFTGRYRPRRPFPHPTEDAQAEVVVLTVVDHIEVSITRQCRRPADW